MEQITDNPIYLALAVPIVGAAIVGLFQFYKSVIIEQPIIKMRLATLEQETKDLKEQNKALTDTLNAFIATSNKDLGELHNKTTHLQGWVKDINETYREEMKEFRESINKINTTLTDFNANLKSLTVVVSRLDK